MIQSKLNNLPLSEVNNVIKKYLQNDNIKFAFIAKDAKNLKNRLVKNTILPIEYVAEKPADILEGDKIIQKHQCLSMYKK